VKQRHDETVEDFFFFILLVIRVYLPMAIHLFNKGLRNHDTEKKYTFVKQKKTFDVPCLVILKNSWRGRWRVVIKNELTIRNQSTKVIKINFIELFVSYYYTFLLYSFQFLTVAKILYTKIVMVREQWQRTDESTTVVSSYLDTKQILNRNSLSSAIRFRILDFKQSRF